MNPVVLCCIENWNMISALANCVLAFLTFVTIVVNIVLIWDSKRPHLQFAITKKEQAFYLKVINVGETPAKKIRLKVSGAPIENSLYKQIKESFEFLKSHSFYIEAHSEKYFCICPDKLDTTKDNYKKWLTNNITQKQITDWADDYHDAEIKVKATYNRIYCASERFSIRGFISLVAYKVKSPLERIAESLSEKNKPHKLM